MKKQILFIVMMLVPLVASADAIEVDGIYYNLMTEGKTAEVTQNPSLYFGSIVIPEKIVYEETEYSVTSIGEDAFYLCSGLTSVEIPNSVTTIGNYAFRNCNSLTSITIPNSVISIGLLAFFDCVSLPSISVDEANTVYTSENGVLMSKDGTTLVTYPHGKKETAYTIPNSVTNIGFCAFYGCSSPTSITIPSSVTTIEGYAFYGCTGLTSIIIPNSVTNIGRNAFTFCTSLKNIVFEDGDSPIFFGSSVLSSSPIESIYWGRKHNTYSPPFSEIKNPYSVTIGNSVTSIEDGAFYYCSGLTSITIPNSVTSIGKFAFNHCYALTSITIPNSVTSIGDGAFIACSGLASIIVETGNTKYDSRDNCNAIIETTTNTLIWGCMNTVIPKSVTSIGTVAFFGRTGLTSITIPNSVTSIGEDAFAWCPGLTTINVETGNTKFDSRDNCNAIIETESNTLIVGCQNTIIPNSVTSIGASFTNCTSLTSVNIPNSVTSIGAFAFTNCTSLTSVNIPNSVTSIGTSAFAWCSGLTSITIPNSVTSIDEAVFYGCTGLTSIAIPNSVTSIGISAFGDCTSLTNITSYATTPPTCDEDAFYNIDKETCKLSVPVGCKSAYMQADQWKDFIFINEDIPTGIQTVSRDSSLPSDIYNINGHKQQELKRGINILKMNDGTTKKVVVK